MAKSGSFFEEFEPHTRHKLLILEQYFERWGYKLGLRQGAEDQLLYVDACAGAGTDSKGTPGSPLVAARAAAEASARVSELRQLPFRIHVIAIESKKKNFQSLAGTLAPFGAAVEVKRGTLTTYLAEIEQRFGTTPTLLFIDPFGMKPLQASVVERALAGPHHEVFALFAGQAALRHFGAVVTKRTRAELKLDREHRRHASWTPSLFAQFDAEDDLAHEQRSAELERNAIASRKHLEITRESATKILDAAYGDNDWMRDVEGATGDRRADLLRAYMNRLRKWGAKYTLPIPILSKDGGYLYTLVHATKSAIGHVTMKEAVEYAMKNSDLPENVLLEMRNAMWPNLEGVVSSVLNQFAGRQVRWAPDDVDRSLPSVRRFVLEETPAWPAQRDDLLGALKPYREPGRTISFEFPQLQRSA